MAATHYYTLYDAQRIRSLRSVEDNVYHPVYSSAAIESIGHVHKSSLFSRAAPPPGGEGGQVGVGVKSVSGDWR